MDDEEFEELKDQFEPARHPITPNKPNTLNDYLQKIKAPPEIPSRPNFSPFQAKNLVPPSPPSPPGPLVPQSPPTPIVLDQPEFDMVNDGLYDMVDAGLEPEMEFYDEMDLLPEEEPLVLVFNEFGEPLLLSESELPLIEEPPMEMLMDPMTDEPFIPNFDPDYEPMYDPYMPEYEPQFEPDMPMLPPDL